MESGATYIADLSPQFLTSTAHLQSRSDGSAWAHRLTSCMSPFFPMLSTTTLFSIAGWEPARKGRGNWRTRSACHVLPCERGIGSHAVLRAFIVFRTMRGFFGAAAAVFFALAGATTGDGNSSLGCFAVRWWPWCSSCMRAASSCIRN